MTNANDNVNPAEKKQEKVRPKPAEMLVELANGAEPVSYTHLTLPTKA